MVFRNHIVPALYETGRATIEPIEKSTLRTVRFLALKTA